VEGLPVNFETGLRLLERGYYLCNGGRVAPGSLPEKIVNFINRLEGDGIDWVLVGAEAVNLYLRNPRATVDVDLIVRQKHLRKVKKVLRETCLEVKESGVHFKGLLSRAPLELTADVTKSQAHELFEVALDRHIVVEGLKVPPLEVSLP
jgi:hypothetical protein